MSITRLLSTILIILCPVTTGMATIKSQLESHPKENVHLFLLAGQSNMAGRGKLSPGDKRVHARVFALSKGGEWMPAVDPIHFDKKMAGVGLGRSFGISLADNHKDTVIGLVPAACGGSPIMTWEPGGYHKQTASHPYDDAIQRMRRAMQDGVVKGILWHQGESDSTPERAAQYEMKLIRLIHRFREDLGVAQVPFIIGQLGQFDSKPWSDPRKLVNKAHISIAKEVSAVGFVPSDGFTPMPDNVHFDAESLREFGRRYAETYLRVAKQNAAADAGKPQR